jgi:hypothetical protein
MAQLRWAFSAQCGEAAPCSRILSGAAIFRNEIRWSCQGRAASPISDTNRRASQSGISRSGGSLMGRRSSHPIDGGRGEYDLMRPAGSLRWWRARGLLKGPARGALRDVRRR